MSFGEKFLAEPIAEFGKIYPDVTLEVEFDDKKVHLIEEGYDLVIRIGSLESFLDQLTPTNYNSYLHFQEQL